MFLDFPCQHCACWAYGYAEVQNFASEVTNLWHYTDLFINTIFVLQVVKIPSSKNKKS